MTTELRHGYCALCISRCGCVGTLVDGVLTRVDPDPAHPQQHRSLQAGCRSRRLRASRSPALLLGLGALHEAGLRAAARVAAATGAALLVNLAHVVSGAGLVLAACGKDEDTSVPPSIVITIQAEPVGTVPVEMAPQVSPFRPLNRR